MHLYFMKFFTIFSILLQKKLKNKEESYFFVIYNNMCSNTLIDTKLLLLYNYLMEVSDLYSIRLKHILAREIA
ncbi:hypothetical protein A5M97_01760 [Streptococcus pneumoniae]|nr:hypothetical protein A5M97_01760 [Streptococcus pneumoniae]